MKLAIATATTNLGQAEECIASWQKHAEYELPIAVVQQTRSVETGEYPGHGVASHRIVGEHLGTVGAFRLAVSDLLNLDPSIDIIACLHDDFRIDEDGWDTMVCQHFWRYASCGLAGFGGATGLGAIEIYQQPYDPLQLARSGFKSNLTDAEAHGSRSFKPTRVSVLDGFSQIGRRQFWQGRQVIQDQGSPKSVPIWDQLDQLGIIHHAYDAALGCLAARGGWSTWYLPLASHHYGGRTAVGDEGYQAWAKTKSPDGDQGLWQAAHAAVYQEFKDVLPLRII